MRTEHDAPRNPTFDTKTRLANSMRFFLFAIRYRIVSFLYHLCLEVLAPSQTALAVEGATRENDTHPYRFCHFVLKVVNCDLPFGLPTAPQCTKVVCRGWRSVKRSMIHDGNLHPHPNLLPDGEGAYVLTLEGEDLGEGETLLSKYP